MYSLKMYIYIIITESMAGNMWTNLSSWMPRREVLPQVSITYEIDVNSLRVLIPFIQVV
ncbi:hypothetical protein HanPSC8_Chr05g0226061 [Helianthus annuus]|nr:hypothetical protein HanPSC8_Chr05g0226061 [Helianthus annuus]